jgi:ATP-binding protein involved in chromosome partitioning
MGAMSAPVSSTVPGGTIEEAIQAALATVNDPEIHRPITELGMVQGFTVGADGLVKVELLLTVAGCPLKDKLTGDITAALTALPSVTAVTIDFGVMTADQRQALQATLRASGGAPGGQGAEPIIPFAQPGSKTRVYAVASGKGGVGKSSVTVNLAASLAKRGLSVGVVDADIYGHSIPRMLGTEARPTRVEEMIMPPQAHGVKLISIGMFTSGNAAVVWRGPMLHRALQQFLADVYWGDLDILLLDLPPGTGDVAISLAQLLPNAEILVVTTPQTAAAEVAERAGAIALQTHQRLVGVVENMSWLELPDGSRMDIFGSGGGAIVAESLTRVVGAQVPLLGQIPLDTRVREAGDSGTPIVLADPTAPAAIALEAVAARLAIRRESLVGKPLSLTPTARRAG